MIWWMRRNRCFSFHSCERILVATLSGIVYAPLVTNHITPIEFTYRTGMVIEKGRLDSVVDCTTTVIRWMTWMTHAKAQPPKYEKHWMTFFNQSLVECLCLRISGPFRILWSTTSWVRDNVGLTTKNVIHVENICNFTVYKNCDQMVLTTKIEIT